MSAFVGAGGAVLILSVCITATHAQTIEELLQDGKTTDNVTT